METTTTNRMRSMVSICVAGMLAAMASGCAASAPAMRMDEVIYLGMSQGDRYAIALAQTLDVHEAQVNAAFDRTYPTIIEANEASHHFVRRDLRPILSARLELLGLTREGLDDYAAQHPEWARVQNRIYEERTRDTRGIAFAIISRVGPSERGPLELPPVGEPASTSTQVAAR